MKMKISCDFVENFEAIYNRWWTQMQFEEGSVFEALGEVVHINVVGRKYRDPSPGEPLGENIGLQTEPENEVDPDAVAIYRGDTQIGYVPRDKTHITKRWMALASQGKAYCVNSPKAIYFFSGLS